MPSGMSVELGGAGLAVDRLVGWLVHRLVGRLGRLAGWLDGGGKRKTETEGVLAEHDEVELPPPLRQPFERLHRVRHRHLQPGPKPVQLRRLLAASPPLTGPTPLCVPRIRMALAACQCASAGASAGLSNKPFARD